MEIDLPVLSRLFSKLLLVLSSLIQLLGGKKSLCTEKQEILKWVSESAGREVRSLQQLWDVGPTCLGRYIEQLNSQDVTWWSLQDLARATLAVPQVMTKTDMCRSHLNAAAEGKFLRLLKRLKEALERTAGNDSSHRLRVSSDIIAKGVALSSAYTGMRGVFFVYSFRNQLEGIKIDMDGPCEAKVETRTRKDGLMVSYIASRRGMYTLVISKNNWFAPGSPFVVNVQDPPIGYKGSFGGTLWDKPDTDASYRPHTVEHNSPPNSLFWDGEADPVLKKKVDFEALPSRPKRKTKFQKSKQQVVELSQIAAAIILARRFTNRMQSRIPELRVERPSDAQELNLWSNMLSPSPSSLREITYVSPEGATFPISVNGGRDGGRQKWGENYDEWPYGPTADPNQGNESYLQSLICPVQEDRLSKMKKSPTPFSRSAQHMVRPFNHGVPPISQSYPPKQPGRIWTHSVSIGVNTEGTNIDPNPGNVEQPSKISKGVQVGRSFLSFEIRDDNSFPCKDPEIKADEPKTGAKQETITEVLMSRAKKCDTFNSDDTSSSVTTNYSEKIIEMDLKVNYETIALTSTDDDELSHSEVRETKRYLSLNDTSYDVPSIVDSNCSSFKTEEAIKPFSIDKPSGNCEEIENEGENAQPRADGIYKATLMSLDNSISAFDKSSEGELSDNEMTPVKIQIHQTSDLLTPLRSPKIVQNRTKPNKTYESIVSEDGQLLTIIVGDEMEVPCKEPSSQFSLSDVRTNPNDVLSGNTSNKTSQVDNKRIDLKHFKYLTKRNWTKKLSSRRLIKQRSVTCKRQLRKTLSFLPKLSDHKDFDPRTNALYSFGSYPVKKDIVHIPTSVRSWKQFWDNIATKAEAKVRKDITVKTTHVPKKEAQPAPEKITRRDSQLRESLKDEDRKRRFLTARQHFTKLEEERKFRPLSASKVYIDDKSTFPQKLAHHWDLKGLFDDFNKGLGKPGVANRLGVLASLYSVEPRFNVGGFQSQYPHLPVSSSNESSPISKREITSGTKFDASMQLISYEADIQNPAVPRPGITLGEEHGTSIQSMSLDPSINVGNESPPTSRKSMIRGVSFDSSMQLSLERYVQNVSATPMYGKSVVPEINQDTSIQSLLEPHIHEWRAQVSKEAITQQGGNYDSSRHAISVEPEILDENRKEITPRVNTDTSLMLLSLEPDFHNVSSPIPRKDLAPEMSSNTRIEPISLETQDRPRSRQASVGPEKIHDFSMVLISLEPDYDEILGVNSQMARNSISSEMNADKLIQPISLEPDEELPTSGQAVSPELNHDTSMVISMEPDGIQDESSQMYRECIVPEIIADTSIQPISLESEENPTVPITRKPMLLTSLESDIQNINLESSQISREELTAGGNPDTPKSLDFHSQHESPQVSRKTAIPGLNQSSSIQPILLTPDIIGRI